MTNRPAKPTKEAILPQPKAFGDQTWETKITRAREARSAAQALRQGKPTTFTRHLAQP